MIYAPPSGECLICGATARYEKGAQGQGAALVWKLADGREEVVPWPYGSNGQYCPSCWREHERERK